MTRPTKYGPQPDLEAAFQRGKQLADDFKKRMSEPAPPTYPNEPLDRADYLITYKGEMSVELWNDRAQCVLAPIVAKIRALEASNAELGKQLTNTNRGLERQVKSDDVVRKSYLERAETAEAKCAKLESEVSRACERLGPAGWRVIERGKAAEARVKVLEEALRKIYTYRSDAPDWNMVMAIAGDAIDPQDVVLSGGDHDAD